MKKFNLIFGISALFLVFNLGCNPREDVENPEACFNYSPSTAILNGDVVTFDANCSKNALSYEWNFDDGESGSGSTTTHRFEEPRDYNVTLTIQNKYLTDQKTETITIGQKDISTACFTFLPTEPLEEESINFNNCSQNSQSFKWDFGDGSQIITSENATHAFNQYGEYNITLSTIDDNGDVTDHTSQTIDIIANVENNRYETVYMKYTYIDLYTEDETITEYKTKIELMQNDEYFIIEFKPDGILYVDGYNEGEWVQKGSEVIFTSTGEAEFPVSSGTISGEMLEITYEETDGTEYLIVGEIHFSKL